VVGILMLAFGLFAGTALVSLIFGDGQLMGPLGRFAARLFFAVAGMGSVLVVAGLVVAAIRLLGNQRPIGGLIEAAGSVLGLFSLAVLLHLIGGNYRVDAYPAGGRLGEYTAEIMRAGVSTAGTALFASVGLFLAIVATTPLEIVQVWGVIAQIGRAAWVALRTAFGEVARFVGEVLRAILPEASDEDDDEDDERASRRTRDTDADEAPVARKPRKKKPTEPTFDPSLEDAAPVAALDGDTIRVDAEEPVIVEAKKRLPKARKLTGETALDASGAAALGELEQSIDRALAEPPAEAAGEIVAAPVSAPSDQASLEPVIVEPTFHKDSKKGMKEKEKVVAENRPDFIPLGDGVYRLPSISLLRYDDTQQQLDKNAMLELSARLVQAMNDYGVKGEVQAIRPGPVVTMYEFSPAPGTRVSKIANLADDLAMRLEAPSVRIVAPIPGKAVVGVEVPNKQRETVYLKEIIADDVFQKTKSKLTIALGKDIEGRPVAVDLAKMPHLLVAGTTGSGKSVCVNTMITSILYNATP
jgi:S-DNA-T family DNA segregation ATPase FtsK/SpoIIIE